MKWIKNLGICFLLLWCVDSCIKEPEYSVVPHIDWQDLYFRKGNLSKGIQDTLIFKLKFTDGDGDLGYGAQDSNSVYNYNPWYWAYSPTTFNRYITVTDVGNLPDTLKWINWQAKKLPQFDTLPGINCENWQPLYSSNNVPAPQVIDTIYVTQNLKAFNISVDLYEKVGSTYVLYKPETDFPFPGCNSNLFRATFPDLSNDRKKSPLDGTITFRIQSFRLYSLFGSKTLKMSVTITDRAYHASNAIEKHDFSLQQITR